MSSGAMDFISPIITFFLDLLGGLCSVFCRTLSLEEDIRSLEKKMRELEASRSDVMRRVDAAKSQHLKCTDKVTWWLQEVHILQNDVQRIRDEYRKSFICFGCHLLNPWSRYSLSNETRNALGTASNLVAEGATLTVADTMPAGHIVIDIPAGEPGVGMEEPMHQLWSYIKGDEVSIIGVHGMGGVGKTTLLQQLCNRLSNHKDTQDFEMILMIELPENPTDEMIQKEIYTKLRLTWVEGETQMIRATHIHGKLRDKGFVILLDDIWNALNLQSLGIPSPKNHSCRCKIVLATRIEQVCKQMLVQQVITVACLPQPDAWNLFLEKVGKELVIGNPELEAHAKTVTQKCGGLPLALVTIGHALASRKTPEAWEHAIWNLSNDVSMVDSTIKEKIFGSLKRSFDHLESDTIKNCFLHCSLFPEGCSFDRQVLSADWICHGIVKAYDGKNLAYAKGHDVIEKLKSECLLEKSGEGKDGVKMHGMMRSLALWIQSDCSLVQARMGLIEAPDVERWKDAKTISLMNNKISKLPEQPLCSKLECLILTANWNLSKIPKGFFHFMGSLQVLDLSWTSLDELPQDIGLLVELRCLDLNNTKLVSLPKEVRNMRKLQFLDISSVPNLTIPDGIISSLSPTLQVFRAFDGFYYWKTGRVGGGVNLRELEGLSRLKILDITVKDVSILNKLFGPNKLPEYIVDRLCLRNLEAMASIHLPSQLGNIDNITQLAIKDSPYLEQVADNPSHNDINWSLPRLITLSFVSLEKLKIVNNLGKSLPYLQTLNVCGCTQLKEIVSGKQCFEDGASSNFEKLKHLYLDDLPELTSIGKNWFDFPFLQTLHVMECPKLTQLPAGMHNCKNLRKIKGQPKWFEELVWEDKAEKDVLESIFKRIGS